MAEELGANRERISLKIDTETNWNNSAVTFIPYNGELLIYRNSADDRPRLKVGDGATLPKDLPFFRDETGGGGGGGSSSITTVNVTPGSGSISADGTTLTININSGSTTTAGVVQLKNSIGNNESSTTTAATPKAVWDALQNYSYTLPLATNGTRGGIQIGFTTSATNRNYAVQLSNEKAYVNVPWTDTNTTYTFATGDSAGQFKVTPSSGNAYNVNVKNVLVTDINNVNKIYVAAPSGTNDTGYPGIMGYRQGAIANTDSSWLVEGIVNDTSVRTAFAQKIKDSSNTAYEVFNLPPTTTTFSSNSNQYIYTTKNVKAGSNISITRDGFDLTIAATGLTSGTVTSVRVQATSPVVSSVNTAQTTTLNTTISLADGYGDTKNPYASKTKNYVLAAPASANGAPSFRALVEDDLIHLYANPLRMTMNGVNNFYGFVPPASDVASSQTYPRAWIYCKYGSSTNGSQIGFGHRYVNNTPAASINYEFPPVTAAIDAAATYRIWTTREYNLDYTTSGKNYKVTKDSNGGLYVNVPWTNTITTVTTTGDGNAVTAISGSNGAITVTKGNSFLPLSGGTMTGQITMAADAWRTNSNAGYSVNSLGALQHLRSNTGDVFAIYGYNKTTPSFSVNYDTGVTTIRRNTYPNLGLVLNDYTRSSDGGLVRADIQLNHVLSDSQLAGVQLAFYQYTTDGTFCERYSLPTTPVDLTAAGNYTILTTRNPVTIAQGGTSATTAAGARTNLDVICKTSDTNVGSLAFTGQISHSASSYWWNGRETSFVRKTSSTNQYAVINSINTYNGTWDIGTYSKEDYTSTNAKASVFSNALYFNFVANSHYNRTRDAGNVSNYVNAYVRIAPPSPITVATALGDMNKAFGRIYANVSSHEILTRYLYVMPASSSQNSAAIALGYSIDDDLLDESTAGRAGAMIGWDHQNSRFFLSQYDVLNHPNASSPAIEYYYLPQTHSITTNTAYSLLTTKNVQSGTVDFAALTGNSTMYQTVTFSPSMLNTNYTIILTLRMNNTSASAEGGGGYRILENIRVGYYAVSTTSFNIYAMNVGTTSTAFRVSWLAIPTT